MRFRLLYLAVFLSACATKVPVSKIKEEAETTRIGLMRAESNVSGDFFKLRAFHSEMMQTTMTPDKTPYSALDSLFQHMRQEADLVILPRIEYDTVYFQIKSWSEKTKLKITSTNQRITQQHDSLRSTLPPLQSTRASSYFESRKAYDTILREQGIRRLGMGDLATLTNEKVTIWLDSLEEIGRMVAAEKTDLRVRFPEQKGADFFKAYLPVSMLESKMKEVESMLTQLQNSLSRFEEGNVQDFIFIGPNIRPRMELQATDNIVSGLSLAMVECRKLQAEYWQQK